MSQLTFSKFYSQLIRAIISEPTGGEIMRERNSKRRKELVKPQISFEKKPVKGKDTMQPIRRIKLPNSSN